MSACFLTGPVTLKAEVRDAFCAPLLSHREPTFIDMLARTRAALMSLVDASHVALLLGSGTLANDAVAAQLTTLPGRGLILSNGEFGERLIDHARRWNLPFTAELRAWGEPFDWPRVRADASRRRPRWVWAVLTETSTGMANPLDELRVLAGSIDAELCLDAVSAVGLMPVDLRGVRFATAVSGKGLAAYPGLAAVFHDGRLAYSSRVPRYLDLSAYEGSGVPYTHSSNLVAALDRSLAMTDWPGKFALVRAESERLVADLRDHGLAPLVSEAHAAPGVVTLAIPHHIDAANVAGELAARDIDVAWQSRYLRDRNWLQIALMGEVDLMALRRLPSFIAAAMSRMNRNPRRTRAALSA